MKLTRHNGRSGKHGTYNPRHNDRRFDVENSEHIDAERARQNVYWDCYRGFTTHDFRENSEQPDFSFEEIERMYYYEHYADHVNAQNARNEKTRHIERNRTVDDLLKNNKTCPEESIYQIGTMEESVPPETLALIVSEFYEEFENRFGSHIHILDWALHLDEGTPHIHERHVFDCENRYGELCPQQEKALEELGIPLPKPEQPKGKHNNRKQTFDAVCRIILFDVAKRHGLHLEQEPSYGGRDYLEKQDYILMKQKEQLATQEQKLEELTLKIEDVETLLEDVSGAAYDKAVEVVTDKVREQTQLEDMEVIEKYRKSVVSPNAKNSPEVVKISPVQGGHAEMIEVNNISYHYHGGKDVLKDVSFALEQGQFLAILGNNGVGKSTLLKCLNKILRADSGQVLLDGENILQMSNHQVSRRMAFVAQTVPSTQMTVHDVVMLGRRPYMKFGFTEKDHQIVHSAMDRLNLDPLRGRFLNQLSGGERQKVMLARALAQQPKLLLLDEPTSSLDIHNQYQVLQIVQELCHHDGLTAIVVIHDLNLALRFCDRFLLLRQGQVYANGNYTVLSPKALQDVYQIDGHVVEVENQKMVLVRQ